MAEIVNLNRVRKMRARAAENAQAAANRVKHGRTPGERANDQRIEARRDALLDGARSSGAAADEAGGAPPSPRA